MGACVCVWWVCVYVDDSESGLAVRLELSDAMCAMCVCAVGEQIREACVRTLRGPGESKSIALV